ncbi:MAG TPA: DUF4386 domain-containing protein [Chitinophagaceae bacterium]|nr:DUF4386 domain-containing protein [Chitinophagaceae bacterium]
MEPNVTLLDEPQVLATNRIQRKSARIAGLAYLLATTIVVAANFSISAKLNVPDNASEAARNILAHESLFRLSLVCYLLYCAGTLVALAALYVLLKPVDRTLSLIAAFCRFVYVLVWAYIVLNFFTALRLISGAGYLKVIEADRLQALAKVFLSGFDGYYVGLLFWSVASTICAWLFFKSHYIPRALSAFGVVASLWCVLCTVIFLIFPTFADIVNLWWFDSGMAIFEVVTSFWLLIKGIRVSAASPRA